MRIFLSFILFFTLIGSSKSQVLEQFRSIEKSKDTMADLRYFKTLDSIIREKLDSFLLFANSFEKADRVDSGFIALSLMKNHQGKIYMDIVVHSEYSSYRIFTLKNANFTNVFAFSFYKSQLILLRLSSSPYRVNPFYRTILHDLMYPELPMAVRKEIDDNATDFQINVPIIRKRYYLD